MRHIGKEAFSYLWTIRVVVIRTGNLDSDLSTSKRSGQFMVCVYIHTYIYIYMVYIYIYRLGLLRVAFTAARR